MKILIIARGIPSSEEPQWGCFEFDQAKALQKLGHDVAVLAVDRRWKPNFKKIGRHIGSIDGIVTEEAFFTPHLFIPSINIKLRTLYFKIAFSKLRKIWGVPDVIYSHYLFNTASIVPWATELSIPVVGLEHWSKLMKKNIPSDVTYLAEKTYNSSNLKLLSVSENLRRAIKNRFGADSKVIPNMIGEEFLLKPSLPKYEKFTFISIGSLIHRKGFDLLIQAASKLTSFIDKEWQIIIIGTGKQKKKLQSMINEKGLSDKINLVGTKTKDEIRNYLAKSHAFVLPSRSETFGVVYIEAMAMGLPVIATNCGIPLDLVNKYNGLICETNNIDEVADAMAYQLNNYNSYSPDYIRKECLSRFSPYVVAKQIENQLYSVINE